MCDIGVQELGGSGRLTALPVILKTAIEISTAQGQDRVGSRTVQNIPERLRREATTVLHPASITPEPTKRCWRRNLG